MGDVPSGVRSAVCLGTTRFGGSRHGAGPAPRTVAILSAVGASKQYRGQGAAQPENQLLYFGNIFDFFENLETPTKTASFFSQRAFLYYYTIKISSPQGSVFFCILV